MDKEVEGRTRSGVSPYAGKLGGCPGNRQAATRRRTSGRPGEREECSADGFACAKTAKAFRRGRGVVVEEEVVVWTTS